MKNSLINENIHFIWNFSSSLVYHHPYLELKYYLFTLNSYLNLSCFYLDSLDILTHAFQRIFFSVWTGTYNKCPWLEMLLEVSLHVWGWNAVINDVLTWFYTFLTKEIYFWYLWKNNLWKNIEKIICVLFI